MITLVMGLIGFAVGGACYIVGYFCGYCKAQAEAEKND